MNRVETRRRGLPHACRAVLGLLLAMATLLAMALPSNTAYAADGDADCSATTLPVKEDGTSVTWPEVRQYIDENFTGSKVFADAVYDAICTSGQDYTDASKYDNGEATHDAAGVVRYFGLNSAGTDPTIITITAPLEDNAVLTGIGLLRNTGRLVIKNTGNHKGLDFIEDAYKPVDIDHVTDNDPMGPSVSIDGASDGVFPEGLTVLPARPYALNLPRAMGNGLITFPSADYQRLIANIVRKPNANGTTIVVDTQLVGRKAAVNLAKLAEADSVDGPYPLPGDGMVGDILPNSEIKRVTNSAVNAASDTSDAISASGNEITFQIPAEGSNAEYLVTYSFGSLYNYYADVALQRNSPNYTYQVDANYFNQVQVLGKNLILSDLRFKKVDEQGNPLPGAKFSLTKDGQPAQKAKVENGQVQLDANGDPEWELVGVLTSDKDGLVDVPYLEPGEYVITETSAPEGYEPDATPQKVTVTADAESKAQCGNQDVSSSSAVIVCGGEGSSIKAFGDHVNATAGFKRATNLDMAWGSGEGNMRLDSGSSMESLDNGVYIKNNGDYVNFVEAKVSKADGTELTPLNSTDDNVSVKITSVKGNTQTVLTNASLNDAKSYVNNLIYSEDQNGEPLYGLTADNALIEVTGSTKVYYAPQAADHIDATITNKKKLQPVDVSLQATKHYQKASGTETDIPAGKSFNFDLTPTDDNARILSKDALTAMVNSTTKTATWNLPQITSDIYENAAKTNDVASFNFTASEQQGTDSTIDYDTKTVPVRLDVSKVVADADKGTPAGLKVEVFVDGQSKGSATSGEKSGSVTVSAKDSGISFTNEEKKPETTKVTVTKVWKGSDNSDITNTDGLPSVDVKLQSATAENPSDSDWSDVKDKTATLSNDNQWSASWDGLPKTDNGKSIKYRVVETKVPDGYTSAVGTSEDSDGNWSVTITNTKKKPELTEVSVKKTWSDGATDTHDNDSVTVTLQQVVDGQTTNVQDRDSITLNKDNNWSGSWKDLPKTTTDDKTIVYTVTESGGPSGYTPTITQGTKDNNWTITVENKKPDTPTPTETSVTVTKKWADGNANHDGDSAEATLERSTNGKDWAKVQRDDNPVTLNADNNWTHTWDKLPTTVDGKTVRYRVVETKVNVSNGKTYTSAVSPASIEGGDVTITNTPSETPKTGSFSFTKVDGDGHALQGAGFTLYRDGTVVAGPVKSNADGVVSFSGLRPGSYTLVETGVPGGYQAAGPYTVTVDENGNVATSLPTGNRVVDEKTPPDTYGFSFAKVDADTGDGLSGGEFTLKSKDGTTVGTAAAVDGEVSFTGLKPGSYTVTETKAPSGYELPSPAPSFTVTIGDKGKVTFSNLGGLVSCKIGTPDGQCDLMVGNKPTTPPPPENPKYPFGFTKVDESGKALAGATFQLLDANGNVVATATSTADGKVSFGQVAPGTYTVVESKAPDGYDKVADFTVTIGQDGVVTGLPEGGKVVDKPTTPPPPENPEYPFGFTKVNTDGQPLAGATFQLVDAIGNVVATVTSGADGKVSFSAVAPGSYTVVETVAPEGYDKVASFTVTIDDQGNVTGLPAGGQVVDKPTTPPKKPKYPFGFTKVNTKGKPLAGATFQLIDASGNVVATVISGADGKVVFSAVEPGRYTVVESKAPDGYQKVDSFTVTIDEDGSVSGLPANGQVVDKPVTPPDVPPTTPPTTPPTPGLPPTGVSVVAMGVVAAGAALMGVIVDWRRRRMRGRHS
ncbi:SpaA isopeptide-forming pilin-related protein [Bifidobacterium miconisargentati]|uniref:SpaA isopeptide-forming pilin-related protein n=1 Tax=Bifidobacterium miconisargentati TaxID=2834437 RepID=UPI001BDBB4DE|nr:SpaA isopeptide-forming pilin-related protein [Bifidobacterium miconisargentati]MBW3089537.1 Cna B-type domain-containing protein [Bifidobacterium miconisargentati]